MPEGMISSMRKEIAEKETEKRRIGWLDIAKVLGIVIVLMNHADLNLPGVNYFGGMYYVPIFFVLAGYTFRMRPEETIGTFVKKKAGRLLIPYAGYNAFLFLFFFIKNQLLSGAPIRKAGRALLGILYSRSYLYAGSTEGQTVLMAHLNGPTWFLTGLFTALLGFRVLLGITGDNRRRLLSGLFACLCIAAGLDSLPVLLPWSLDTMFFHIALMGAGYLLRECGGIRWLYGKPLGIAGVSVGFLITAALSGSGNLSIRDYGRNLLLFYAAALTGSVLAMLFAKWLEETFVQAGSLLAFVGSHTIPVLCLHLFVFMLYTAGCGILGISADGSGWKLLEILAAFLVLVPFYRWRPLTDVKRDCSRTACGLLLLVLILWSLPFTGQGIDVRDTGSYLTKYRYIFCPGIHVNELHYFLGEVAGGIIYALTPVRKVLALNVASSVVYVITALLVHRMLRRYLPPVLSLGCALTGSFYGITWIRTLNWNAWTALLLSAGLLLLFRGLETDDQKLLGASGFLLAINTYFRMPNMLFLALIAVIFWDKLLKNRENLGENGGPKAFYSAFKGCMGFFLGAVAAAVVGLLLALCLLGPETVIKNLSVLTSVGAGENEGNTHSITTGIYLFLVGMRDGGSAWIRLGVPVGGLWALSVVLGRRLKESLQGKLSLAVLSLAGIFGIWQGISQDVLTAHEWVAFGAIALSILGTFYYAGKERSLSCFCTAVMIVEGLLTIGTDTGVNYYRVYMGLPLGLLLILLCRAGRQGWHPGELLPTLGRTLAVFSFAFVTAAGIRYAATHVYHDASNAELTASIDSEMYGGIRTSQERAASLNRLMEELEPYSDKKLLQIGCFNIGCVLTDMKPFYDSSWPDLEYLPMEEFESKLMSALETGNAPVLLLGTAEESGMNWSPKKYELIRNLGESTAYRTLCVDPLYTIYVPVDTDGSGYGNTGINGNIAGQSASRE